MAHPLTAQSKKNYFCITLGSRLTSFNTFEVKKAVQWGLKMKHKIVLFNAKYMHIIDSSGIGVIAFLHKELKRIGGKVCLAALQPKVANVIESCSLHKVIEIFPTLSEAQKALDGVGIEEKGFYALLPLPKKLDLDTVSSVRTQINKTIAADYRHFVIDFKDTDFVSSVGIGTLLNLYKTLKGLKGELYFLNVSPELHNLFDEVNINKVITEYESLEEIEAKFL